MVDLVDWARRGVRPNAPTPNAERPYRMVVMPDQPYGRVPNPPVREYHLRIENDDE